MGSSTHIQFTNITDLKFGQQEAPTWTDSWRKFQLYMTFDKLIELDVFGDPFLQIWPLFLLASYIIKSALLIVRMSLEAAIFLYL